jgi:restriction system protein
MAAELAATVDEFESKYRQGMADAIRDYCAMVLERSEYPESLQPDFDAEYDAASKKISVDMLVPSIDIIPTVVSHQHVKSRDVIEAKGRKPKEISDLYHQLLASIALRTIHELFEADQGAYLETVAFSGYVNRNNDGKDSETANEVVSVCASRIPFMKIDLRSANPLESLKILKGTITSK